MRIAFVYDAVFPYVLGGAERRVWEIARRLAARGNEVHLFGTHCWEGARTITNEGVTLHGICRYHPGYRKARRRVLPAVIFGAAAFFSTARERFDVVDCQQFPFTSPIALALSSRISRTPLVVTWHEVWGDYWYEYLGLAGSAGKAVERALARYPASLIAISETTRDGLLRLAGAREILIAPGGIDLKEIRSTRPSETVSDIIFAGRLIPEKHADLLIEAVKILTRDTPALRCIIIGDGPERSRLEARTRALGLERNITFMGFLKEARDVIAHMKSSRVFVLPSTREGFGIAVLEALASGIAVVTIDHPMNASRMLVDRDCGGLARPDAEDLAETIRDVLQQGRPPGVPGFVEDYDWERITDRVEAYYRSLSRGT